MNTVMTLLPPNAIFEVIRSNQDDSKTLLASILVNRTWFKEGIKFLWRSPPPKALACVKDPWRSEYARNVQQLTFDGDDGRYHAALRHLHFPNLNKVSIDYYWPSVGTLEIGQYIQSSLKEFCFFGGNLDLDKDVLEPLARRCKILRLLTMDFPATTEHIAAFQQVMRQSVSLEAINLGPHAKEFVTEEILKTLLTHSSLSNLELWSNIQEEALSRVVSDIDSKSLQRLRLVIEAEALPILVSVTISIQNLGLEVVHDGTRVLSTISSASHLQALRHLELDCCCQDLLIHEVLAVKGLGNLRTLKIQSNGEGDLQSSSLRDEDFQSLTRSLLHLEHLHFLVQCNLTVHGIRSLSTRLKSLEMLGSFNLTDLSDEVVEPKFQMPDLEYLDLGPLPVVGRSTQDYMEMLLLLFPGLDELHLGGRTDTFSQGVVDAFKQRLGAEYNT